MGKIRNWKILLENVSLETAVTALEQQRINLVSGPIAIQNSKTWSFYEKFDSSTIRFKPSEIGNTWMILVPDTDAEEKNAKVREWVKESNCSGYNYNKIDNMTIKEIWEMVSNKLNEDQQYRMLKYFYENKIYKTK